MVQRLNKMKTDNNKLIKVLKTYPYILTIMVVFYMFFNLEIPEPDMAYIPWWYTVYEAFGILTDFCMIPVNMILFIFNIVMSLKIIKYSFKMLEDGNSTESIMKLAIDFKKNYLIVFLIFIVCGYIGYEIPLFIVFLICYCWFMLIMSGSVSCAGFIKEYSVDNIKFIKMIICAVVQFIPFIDIVVARKCLTNLKYR